MRIARLTTTMLAAATLVALIAPAAEAKKGGGTLNTTSTVNALVPDRAPLDGPYGHLTTTIKVGKKFKGREIRDVNVTVLTAGATGALPTNDLDMFLTAPNGSTVHLINNLFGSSPGAPVSIGPLTLDDESPLSLGRGSPENPTELYAPYAGSATPEFGALANLDNGRVKGTWRLDVTDNNNNGETSLLSFWTLKVKTGKPYLTD